jgi:hypothetical protein
LAGNRAAENRLDLQAVISEYAKLTNSPEPYERVVGALCVTGILTKRLAQLSDREIGQLVSDYVLTELPWSSPQMAICEEAAQRLSRSVENDTTKTV